MINGYDSLVITKLDVLDELEKVPVCVGYRRGRTETSEVPVTLREFEELTPVYECLPGWLTSTAGISDPSSLPVKAREYLEFLEKHIAVEIGCISTGPERSETIVKQGSRFEALMV